MGGGKPPILSWEALMAGTGRSVMRHQFSQVPRADIPRSSFDRSHGYKTTFNAGLLVPIFVDEVLPGDTFNLSLTAFARLSTPLHPIMDNMFFDTFFFFIPNRLIWSNFVRFFGEQDNPSDSVSFLVPTMTSTASTGYGELSIFDYMGIPTKVPGLVHSAMWLRAYNLVWNEWFRDENLQTSVKVNKGDGPDLPADYVLLRRGKRHDYFTSCLPWPQKGPAVSIPLGSFANVIADGDTGPQFYGPTGTATAFTSNAGAPAVNSGTVPTATLPWKWAVPNLKADLGTATAATINQLRQAFQVQKIYERDARGGTRYTELIQAHFGVTSPDARLQRSEYLGGGSTVVNVNPIAQTEATEASHTPLGTLGAMGTVHSNGNGFSKSFTEHGVLIGLASVRADLNYQDGLNRMWSRSSRFDFYWPALSNIGEQAVLNKEIFAQGTVNPGLDASVFGYQERYAEYRYKPSLVTGQMRSNAALPLDTWHLAQDFSALPLLNAAFIQENPPISRIVAVPTEPNFLLDCYFSLRCARPMPVYGIPGLIDHF
ncbi:major capsid protein [Blackfly microvirus SF02]|uniref:Major capsid protein n=1 Tax=Blackfly microvirus SF02 TaxID=2576452 RepID=A0A4P8PLW0_9VIRU|nr:major capsid protein [Blackfly microvirus SF02]